MARIITQELKDVGIEAYVLDNESIGIHHNGALEQVIKTNGKSANQLLASGKKIMKTGELTESLNECIAYLVLAKKEKIKLEDFKFYNSRIKLQLKEFHMYDEIINGWKLSQSPYGLNWRTNKAEMMEIQKDPDAAFSIFDDLCFLYYLIKYCEVVDVDALLYFQSIPY